LSAALFKNHQICKYGLLSAKQVFAARVRFGAARVRFGAARVRFGKSKAERIVESRKQKRKIQD